MCIFILKKRDKKSICTFEVLEFNQPSTSKWLCFEIIFLLFQEEWNLKQLGREKELTHKTPATPVPDTWMLCRVLNFATPPASEA